MTKQELEEIIKKELGPLPENPLGIEKVGSGLYRISTGDFVAYTGEGGKDEFLKAMREAAENYGKDTV